MSNPEETAELTHGQVVEDGLRPVLGGGRRFWTAAAITGALFLLGILAFIVRLRDGFGDRTAWGYYAATFSYLLATAASAPVVAIGLRMAGADWRRPFTRAAELFAVVGVFMVLLFLPLLALVPHTDKSGTIWLGWPNAHLYDGLALAALVFCGLLLLYASALPDFAACRDAIGGGIRKQWFAWLAWRWWGSVRQWRLQRAALGLLGGFYLTLLVMVYVLISSDFALGLVPGWKDPLFPFQQAMSGIQTAVALTVVMMALLRRVGYRTYIETEHFWAMAKILLALSLLWVYFWFSGFIVMWYGRLPVERNLLKLLWFGPYQPLFLATFVLNFLGPFLVLMWNPLRRSIAWPVAVSVMIMAGTLMERIRFYVASYSVRETGAILEHIPPAHVPDAADILLLVGGLAGAAFTYLMATKIVPVISVWEVREGLILRLRRSLVKIGVWVLAKTE